MSRIMMKTRKDIRFTDFKIETENRELVWNCGPTKKRKIKIFLDKSFWANKNKKKLIYYSPLLAMIIK